MSIVIVMLIRVVWLLIVPSVGCDSESIVDLTHPLNSETLHWVEARDFELKVVQNGTIRDGEHSYWYQMIFFFFVKTYSIFSKTFILFEQNLLY